MERAVPDPARFRGHDRIDEAAARITGSRVHRERRLGLPGAFFQLGDFRHEVRARETPHFDAWFAAHHCTVEHLPEGVYFEGAGDALFCGPILLAGYRIRSDVQGHQYLAKVLGKLVLPLELINRAFTISIPVSALSHPARPSIIRPLSMLTAARCCKAMSRGCWRSTKRKAHRFAANAVVVGKTVVLNTGCDRLAADLRSWGYEPVATELDEFLKAGGSAKCLTLRLDGEEAAVWDEANPARA